MGQDLRLAAKPPHVAACKLHARISLDRLDDQPVALKLAREGYGFTR